MEGESLARRIQQPEFVARDLLRMHREVYKVFWEWSDNSVDYTILTGKQQTVFGWTNRVKDVARRIISWGKRQNIS